MFGGWGVTIFGNMAVGVMDTDLIVRVGPDAFADALERRAGNRRKPRTAGDATPFGRLHPTRAACSDGQPLHGTSLSDPILDAHRGPL